ncbi:MAG: MaoC family dehydratase [Deltaproteobacteria bacterium]|nr:MaoC family dehydratase [Deltaproteobacteria bacterium]
MIEVLPLSKIKERVGTELGVSDWFTVTQDQMNQFADLTGDQQWIHVDVEKSAQGPFGRTIASGYMTASLIPRFSSQVGVYPEGMIMAINYGMNKLRLLNPVLEGSRIRGRIALTGLVEKSGGRILMTNTHTIEIEGQEKPACVAEVLTLFYTGEPG